jgi:ABC-type antimicrobial peptide transport system permease subunit
MCQPILQPLIPWVQEGSDYFWFRKAKNAANKWLQNFAFKIHLSLSLFIAGGIIMLLLALIILLIRTYNAAMANPVKSLRSE